MWIIFISGGFVGIHVVIIQIVEPDLWDSKEFFSMWMLPVCILISNQGFAKQLLVAIVKQHYAKDCTTMIYKVHCKTRMLEMLYQLPTTSIHYL